MPDVTGKRFPTKQEIADFIRDSPAPVGKREIARAFRLGAAERVQLKEVLRELTTEGEVERGPGRRIAAPAALPAVALVEATEIDLDGELLARPVDWTGESPPPVITLAPARQGHPALAPGDRVLARLRRLADGTYEGRTLRRLDPREITRVVGVYRREPGGGRIRPAEKGDADPVAVAEADAGGARDGELVVAELVPMGRLGRTRAVVRERLGDARDPRTISLIAIAAAGIPTEFPAEAVAQAERARPAGLDGREDLRALPLVTIDGPDARDFDDAVWAEPDPHSANPGGWHLVVAIADVAHYVTPDSPLDREAVRRGNSCYFPDRVVPMLPEALSNGLCSLRPGEARAVLAAHLWIDRDGRLRRHRFVRGLMRSAARLTYEQVQAARNGVVDDPAGPLAEPHLREVVLAPLYGAYAALAAGRESRGTLDLDVPERTVRLDGDGRIAAIGIRPRLDSHRLIEEFMIAANVAAAETLEARQRPCLYRVHAPPDPAKIEALREFLGSLGYSLAKGQVLRPASFAHILDKAAGRPEAGLVNQVILRSQSQASYSPENIGHFGLALTRYAHFTSPIRRYADLVVHRALIALLGLGPGGITAEQADRLDDTGTHISMTERRAAMAERDALDRYLAAYLAGRIGGLFSGTIGGVTRFGLFVTLSETGADGLLPISSLPDDFYIHDEAGHALVGRRWGRVYRLGAAMRVRLVEADAVSGGLVLAPVDDDGADLPGLAAPSADLAGARRGRPPRRGFGPRRRH